MSASNGVIRIGRKGIKKFAFGEDGKTFEVDVVQAFQQWIGLDDTFRDNDTRVIRTEDMPAYHRAAVDFVELHSATQVTIAEALDFIARLREQYDELAIFFQPKSPEKRDSSASSASELRFSAEDSSVSSTN